MEKKQSSIDYLIEELEGENNRIAMVVGLKKYNSIIKQAKVMHKEEIQYTYWEGGMDKPKGSKECEQYYNETYGETKN